MYKIYSKNEFEIRLYGIDAPEIKICPKIIKDEKELQMPAALLIKLGYLSFDFFRSLISIGDTFTLIQESNNLNDKYGRQLGYIELENGITINEIIFFHDIDCRLCFSISKKGYIDYFFIIIIHFSMSPTPFLNQ